MINSDLVLNLFCLDKGIIQLSDLDAAEKQFASLSPSEKRAVSRKLKKLSKKYIRSTTNPGPGRQAALRAAGFLEAKPGYRNRKKYERIRLVFVKRYLRHLILCKSDDYRA